MKLISRASAFLALCGLLSATSTAQTPAVFHPGDKLAAGGSPWKTAVGDVDGNETPDLVVARGGSVSVLLNSDPVLLNSATAAFEGPTTSIAAGLSPNAVAIGKLNADGFGDLVTVNLDGTISVLLGTGTGSFEAPTAAGAITNPLTMALADLNGDSFSDLVRPQSWSKTVLVQFGDGSGGFEPGVLWLYAMPSSPQSVAIGDVNGDSNPDLVTALDEWDVLVMLGGGTGLDVFQLGSKGGLLVIGRDYDRYPWCRISFPY